MARGGSLRGELVFASRDAGEYLRRPRFSASSPPLGISGEMLWNSSFKFCPNEKEFSKPSTLISALVAARWWMRNARYTDMRAGEWMEEGRKRGYLAVSWWMLGIALRAEEGLVSFQFSFDSADGISFLREIVVGWLITGTLILNWEGMVSGFRCEICDISFLGSFMKLNVLKEKNIYRILCILCSNLQIVII